MAPGIQHPRRTATGKVLEELKDEYGISAAEIGRQPGAPDTTTLSRIARGRNMPSREDARQRLAERIAKAFTHAVDSISNPLDDDQQLKLFQEAFQRIKTALDEDVAMTIPFAASEKHGMLLKEPHEVHLVSIVRLAEDSDPAEPDSPAEGEIQLTPKQFHPTKYEIVHDDQNTILLRLPETDSLASGAHLILGDKHYILEQLSHAPHLYRIRELDLVGVLTFFIGWEDHPESNPIRLQA